VFNILPSGMAFAMKVLCDATNCMSPAVSYPFFMFVVSTILSALTEWIVKQRATMFELGFNFLLHFARIFLVMVASMPAILSLNTFLLRSYCYDSDKELVTYSCSVSITLVTIVINMIVQYFYWQNFVAFNYRIMKMTQHPGMAAHKMMHLSFYMFLAVIGGVGWYLWNKFTFPFQLPPTSSVDSLIKVNNYIMYIVLVAIFAIYIGICISLGKLFASSLSPTTPLDTMYARRGATATLPDRAPVVGSFFKQAKDSLKLSGYNNVRRRT